MYINTDTIFSMTQANQNFSSVARSVDRNGEAVVFKNNKKKYNQHLESILILNAAF